MIERFQYNERFEIVKLKDWLPEAGPIARRAHRFITSRRISTGGELSCWEDKSQPNQDLPDDLQILEQGTSHAKNPEIDVKIEMKTNPDAFYSVDLRRSLNCADFRERCQVYGNKLYVVYQKTQVDLNPVWYLDFEDLADRLDCSDDIAIKIVELVKTTNMNRSMAHKLIYGYTMADGSHPTGLIGLKGNNDQLAKVVDTLESIYMVADYKDRDYGVPENRLNSYFDERMIYYTEPEVQAQFDPDNPEAEWDDGLDYLGDTNPFSAFPLSDRRDGVKYEFIKYIKSADIKEIGKIQKLFFKTDDAYSGRVYPAKLGYLTTTQKSQCWAFINERKEQLADQGLREMGPDGKEVLSVIRQIGKGPQARAMIMAWANGSMFDLAGEQFDFNQKPSELEVYAMWAEYRRL